MSITSFDVTFTAIYLSSQPLFLTFRYHLQSPYDLFLSFPPGDCKFEIVHVSGRTRTVVAWFWLNTALLDQRTSTVKLRKHQIDELCKSEIYSDDLNIEIAYRLAVPHRMKEYYDQQLPPLMGAAAFIKDRNETMRLLSLDTTEPKGEGTEPQSQPLFPTPSSNAVDLKPSPPASPRTVRSHSAVSNIKFHFPSPQKHVSSSSSMVLGIQGGSGPSSPVPRSQNGTHSTTSSLGSRPSTPPVGLSSSAAESGGFDGAHLSVPGSMRSQRSRTSNSRATTPLQLPGPQRIPDKIELPPLFVETEPPAPSISNPVSLPATTPSSPTAVDDNMRRDGPSNLVLGSTALSISNKRIQYNTVHFHRKTSSSSDVLAPTDDSAVHGLAHYTHRSSLAAHSQSAGQSLAPSPLPSTYPSALSSAIPSAVVSPGTSPVVVARAYRGPTVTDTDPGHPQSRGSLPASAFPLLERPPSGGGRNVRGSAAVRDPRYSGTEIGSEAGLDAATRDSVGDVAMDTFTDGASPSALPNLLTPNASAMPFSAPLSQLNSAPLSQSQSGTQTPTNPGLGYTGLPGITNSAALMGTNPVAFSGLSGGATPHSIVLPPPPSASRSNRGSRVKQGMTTGPAPATSTTTAAGIASSRHNQSILSTSSQGATHPSNLAGNDQSVMNNTSRPHGHAHGHTHGRGRGAPEDPIFVSVNILQAGDGSVVANKRRMLGLGDNHGTDPANNDVCTGGDRDDVDLEGAMYGEQMEGDQDERGTVATAIMDENGNIGMAFDGRMSVAHSANHAEEMDTHRDSDMSVRSVQTMSAYNFSGFDHGRGKDGGKYRTGHRGARTPPIDNNVSSSVAQEKTNKAASAAVSGSSGSDDWASEFFGMSTDVGPALSKPVLPRASSTSFQGTAPPTIGRSSALPIPASSLPSSSELLTFPTTSGPTFDGRGSSLGNNPPAINIPNVSFSTPASLSNTPQRFAGSFHPSHAQAGRDDTESTPPHISLDPPPAVPTGGTATLHVPSGAIPLPGMSGMGSGVKHVPFIAPPGRKAIALPGPISSFPSITTSVSSSSNRNHDSNQNNPPPNAE